MPELAEIKIMSDYINENSKDRTFTKAYHVEKGNIPVNFNFIENFKVEADSNGKELILKMYHDDTCIDLSVFMGMSGNWLFTPTETWSNRKFTRLRLDTTDGNSLLLYGLYMGPKYRVGGFTGVKRGVDPNVAWKRVIMQARIWGIPGLEEYERAKPEERDSIARSIINESTTIKEKMKNEQAAAKLKLQNDKFNRSFELKERATNERLRLENEKQN